MKNLLFLVFLASLSAQAQPEASLSNRFNQIKDKAQTFKDYKVIKETTLTTFWQSVEDTLALTRRDIKLAKMEIASLKNQMEQAKLDVQKREEAVAEIVFDSEHITVAGISFHKAAFISFVFIIVASLAGLMVFVFTRSQLLSRSLKEKSEVLLIQSSEFEEYKHRAVEKQMKLSRELQDERNKLSELKVSR